MGRVTCSHTCPWQKMGLARLLQSAPTLPWALLSSLRETLTRLEGSCWLGPFTQGKGKPEACGSAGEQPGLERSRGRRALRSGEAASSCSGSGAGARHRKWWGAGLLAGQSERCSEAREVRSGCKTPGGLAARNTRQRQVCGRAARLGFLFQVLLLP